MPYVISYDEVIIQGLNGKLSRRIINNGLDMLFKLRKSIEKIVNESGIPYPPIIVLPEARVLVMEEGLSAIVYANLSIRRYKGRITPVVEFLLPFLLYGGIQSKTAVLAHELLHYMYLAMKFYLNEYFIHPLISTSGVSGRYLLEETYQLEPELVFRSGRIGKLVSKLESILIKDRIAYKIRRNWINRSMPTKMILSQDFKINLSIEDMSNLYFPDEVMTRVSEIVHERGLG